MSQIRNMITGCFYIILALILVIGFIILGPFYQIRDQVCKYTHNIFCGGIIDVQNVTVGPDVLNVGLSQGNDVFDVRGANANYKQQAVNDMKAGRSDDAVKAWQQAINVTTDDAESMIYIENKSVADSHKPYLTIVVATTLSQIINDPNTSASVGLDDLRGAYWAQREFNATHSDIKLRLVIANLGVKVSSYLDKTEGPVLQQIIRLSQTDDTFVGVVGFPFSASAKNAISDLAAQHISIISPSASSKDLSTFSNYFFRVVPSDTQQGLDAAQFASEVLSARRVAVLSDGGDAYSGSLADSFAKNFTALRSDHSLISQSFALNNADSLNSALNSALSQNPDLIFLAGYANDLNNLKDDLAKTGNNIRVMGGDAAYELGGYAYHGNYTNFYFSAFTYPDTWDIICPSGATCATDRPSVTTISAYATLYDPRDQHPGEYGYARMGAHVLLNYDATSALLRAANNVLSISNGRVRISLESVRGAVQGVSFQGASGQISFSPSNSDPVNKNVLMLCVDGNHHTQLVKVYGQFASGVKDYSVSPDYVAHTLCA
jgi:eukaryotic-like serine/threonine-protein kinase